MSIDLASAKSVLLAEAANAEGGRVDSTWCKRIEHFSDVCETSTLTHVAFLGTALLAKAVDLGADVWAVKAGSKHPGAYSARSLCHGVIVPAAVRLGISLGVTGREPLNNQPYFQIQRLSRTTTVHANAKPALLALCDLLDIAEKVSTTEGARAALRAFIFVRRQRNPSPGTFGNTTRETSIDSLILRINDFVSQKSEGGKRAQAVATGLLDAFAGVNRVVTSRVNDPSRNAPGDVNIRPSDDSSEWQKVFEIRDKPIRDSDLYAFAQRCVTAGAVDAGIVAVSARQAIIDVSDATEWAAQRGLALVVFIGWKPFVEQVLFWAATPAVDLVRQVPELIFNRLVELEVSIAGTDRWRAVNE